MASFARWFVTIGLIFILLGGMLYLFARMGIPLGRLPGDIRIVRENLTCVFPLVTSIILSIVLTILLNIFLRLFDGK